MKKERLFVFLVLALVLSSFLVCAENSTGNQTENQELNLENANAELKNVQSGFIDRSEEILNKEIEIPASIKGISYVLLGIKENNPSIENFVMHLAVAFFFFILFFQFLKIMPFFNSGISRLIGALVFACLMGVSGASNFVVIFFLDLGGLFGTWESLEEKSFIFKVLKVFSMILAVLWIIIFLYGVSVITRIIKNKQDELTAEQTGAEAGVSIRALKEFFNWGIKGKS